MALTARLVSDRFPYIPLTVMVRGRRASGEALLDTGFNGDLILPTAAVASTARPDGFLSWRMVDGTPIQTPIYRGTVQISTLATLDVVIAIVGDEPIIGRSLLDRFTIILDHGQRVIVEP